MLQPVSEPFRVSFGFLIIFFFPFNLQRGSPLVALVMHTGVPSALGEALAVGVSQPCPGGSAGTAGKTAPNWFIWVRVAEKAAIPLKDGFSPFGWN